jgi:hypothetical protein
MASLTNLHMRHELLTLQIREPFFPGKDVRELRRLRRLVAHMIVDAEDQQAGQKAP